MENKTNIKKTANKTSMVGGLLINGLKRVKLESLKKIAQEKSLAFSEVEELKTRIEKLYRFASPQKVAYDMLYLLADHKHLTNQIAIINNDCYPLANDRDTKREELVNAKTRIESLEKERDYWIKSSTDWKALTNKYRLITAILSAVLIIAVIAVVVLIILLCL